VTAVDTPMATDERFVLEAKDVSVRFGGTVALNGVSIGLRAGTILGLVGPNGAGKTTLFDLLTGVTRSSGGTVHLGGEDISNRSMTWRARHGLKRTFQRQQVFGWLTVEENLLCALEWHGGGGGLAADVLRLPRRRRFERERMVRVEQVMERCGLADLHSTPAAGLSIGTSRLVELGRAIIDEPTVLLLDEPTSGLDESEVARLGAVVSQLSRESRCAIGLVEHNMAFVMGLCEEIVVLNLGSVLATGSPAQIQRNDIVAEAYLGS
jgi:branched-chain amino acid transport system ATP-binding protein